MGHCFSCFDSTSERAVTEPPVESGPRKDEMTESETARPAGAGAPSERVQTGRRPPPPGFDLQANGNRKGGFGPFARVDVGGAVSPGSDAGRRPSQRGPCQKRTSRPTSNAAEQRPSAARIGALFDQYRDPNEEAVLADGIERLCADLQLRPDEFRVLVLAWKLNAEQMCRFTKTEFVRGLEGMKVDTVGGIRARLPEIANELRRDDELFKDLYRFTFKFGLDAAAGQRILPADVAIALWRLVFTAREPPVLERWLGYLERHPHVRGVPKDTWYMFLNFCDAVGEDLGGYDDTEAWPSLFDDFVEYENDQMNQNISKNESFKKSD